MTTPNTEYRDWLEVHPEGNYGVTGPLTAEQWFLQIKDRMPKELNEHARICFVAANYQDYCRTFRKATAPNTERLLALADKWDSVEYAIEQVNNPLPEQEQCAIELRAELASSGNASHVSTEEGTGSATRNIFRPSSAPELTEISELFYQWWFELIEDAAFFNLMQKYVDVQIFKRYMALSDEEFTALKGKYGGQQAGDWLDRFEATVGSWLSKKLTADELSALANFIHYEIMQERKERGSK